MAEETDLGKQMLVAHKLQMERFHDIKLIKQKIDKLLPKGWSLARDDSQGFDMEMI